MKLFSLQPLPLTAFIAAALLLLAPGCTTNGTGSGGPTIPFQTNDLSPTQQNICKAFQQRKKTGTPGPWREDLAFLPFGLRGDQPRVTFTEPDLLALLGQPDNAREQLDGSLQLGYKLGAMRYNGNTYDVMMNVFHNADKTVRTQTYTVQDQQY